MTLPLVNAWTEWGELEEMVVGRADGAWYYAPEPALEGDFPPKYVGAAAQSVYYSITSISSPKGNYLSLGTRI